MTATRPVAVARGLAKTLLGGRVWVLLHLDVLGAPNEDSFQSQEPQRYPEENQPSLTEQLSTRQREADTLVILRGPISYLYLNGHLKRICTSSSSLPVTFSPCCHHAPDLRNGSILLLMRETLADCSHLWFPADLEG